MFLQILQQLQENKKSKINEKFLTGSNQNIFNLQQIPIKIICINIWKSKLGNYWTINFYTKHLKSKLILYNFKFMLTSSHLLIKGAAKLHFKRHSREVIILFHTGLHPSASCTYSSLGKLVF